ncbi:methylated-DNA--[protein]-cysteine S-methyltransferase [Spirobacillus cienkowskii]|jgi:AraC family transcriptional regulator of adaptative response/methylated-DNA-[protein]-cysteine methyltransferase|uniref:methylated-DNA--[protein]-cysteine S-methyltransferase n=1 Tax=Spirobacillus cienkowskii TaxID=495820 RepID=A0A369KVR1_9BACT|nr:MAG: methylated-DNA--[protein]-cysteine S-methyltransferase [Spirobacillus cienkowskii]
MYYLVSKCKFGNIAIAFENNKLNALIFSDSEDDILKNLSCIMSENNLIISNNKNDIIWFQEIINSIEYPTNVCPVSINLNGTEFQKKVWNNLIEIPYGKTMSYSKLAAKIGNKNATRAVARACASNKIAYFIPCHRVIASNGKLSGYRWGINTKQALLKHEAKILS